MDFDKIATTFGAPFAGIFAIYYVWVTNRKAPVAKTDAAALISGEIKKIEAALEKQEDQIVSLRERVANLEGRRR